MFATAPLRLLIALCIALLSSAGLSADDKVDFNRDVRPILSKKCFACHGPDAEGREGGLRLDLRDVALAAADSGARAIVPGKIDESELLRRVLTADEAERMPPVDVGEPLTKEQVTLLQRWIKQGANYAQHWSFVKPQRPELPQVENTAWPRNSIDHFVLARLEAVGLPPALQADRYTLIRRLSFDLRGLPPTPEEVDAFINDTDPQAYEKLVDQFLSEQTYGERWAQMWLDLACGTPIPKGYGSDPLSEIWRYRDWVIDAFNDNMPYDQFTVEQIAGDLLPGALTRSSKNGDRLSPQHHDQHRRRHR